MVSKSTIISDVFGDYDLMQVLGAFAVVLLLSAAYSLAFTTLSIVTAVSQTSKTTQTLDEARPDYQTQTCAAPEQASPFIIGLAPTTSRLNEIASSSITCAASMITSTQTHTITKHEYLTLTEFYTLSIPVANSSTTVTVSAYYPYALHSTKYAEVGYERELRDIHFAMLSGFLVASFCFCVLGL